MESYDVVVVGGGFGERAERMRRLRLTGPIYAIAAREDLVCSGGTPR